MIGIYSGEYELWVQGYINTEADSYHSTLKCDSVVLTPNSGYALKVNGYLGYAVMTDGSHIPLGVSEDAQGYADITNFQTPGQWLYDARQFYQPPAP